MESASAAIGRRAGTRRVLMAGTDKRKQSLYFPEDMLREIQEEANRQDRSLSWIVQQAWKIARNEIMRFPSVNDVIGGEPPSEDREQTSANDARKQSVYFREDMLDAI